jgi:hypothetical protein
MGVSIAVLHEKAVRVPFYPETPEPETRNSDSDEKEEMLWDG